MAELSISKKHEGSSLLVDIGGDLVMGEPTARLRHSVRESLNSGITDFTFDLADVEYVDSSGIGELISSLTSINREKGRMVLLNPTDRVHQLLEVSHLTHIFEISYHGSGLMTDD